MTPRECLYNLSETVAECLRNSRIIPLGPQGPQGPPHCCRDCEIPQQLQNQLCTHCGKLIQPPDELIETAEHVGPIGGGTTRRVSLCRKCYDKAGNSVR